jgi:hypothetical protein
MDLFVYWGPAETADMQEPKEIKWADGTQAAYEDYQRLSSSTQCSHGTERGMVTVFMPDVTAVARYDSALGHWTVHENGSLAGPVVLLQADPMATDSELQDEIANYPVAYRTIIERSYVPDTSVVQV